MAERNPAKRKRPDSLKIGPPPEAKTGLAEENARLVAELTAAQARIAELEHKQAEIINRIDWVIDSLHNLAD
jgi:hypothetical protein